MSLIEKYKSDHSNTLSRLSLVKLIDCPIQDIEVYITRERGDYCLGIRNIVLSNGQKIEVDGCHDLAYCYFNKPIDEDLINRIGEEIFKDDE